MKVLRKFKIKLSQDNINLHEYLFGEDQSRYLIEIKEKNINKVSNILEKNSIYFEMIGKTQKDSLEVNKDFSTKITELIKLNSFWFDNYFGEN